MSGGGTGNGKLDTAVYLAGDLSYKSMSNTEREDFEKKIEQAKKSGDTEMKRLAYRYMM